MEFLNGLNTLVLDCSSGVSGDMFVGAMLDLGADKEKLKSALLSLNTDDFTVEIKNVNKSGIAATKYDVVLKEHDHHNDHDHAEHHHVHRNLSDIEKIIDGGNLKTCVKDLSKKMFKIVAEAESKVHGKPIDEVHFHEVGAADSIADIVAAAFCLDNLNIGKVVVTSLCEGSGRVHCAHGDFFVPVPATAEILAENKIPFKITDTDGEMITPTGAAILAAISSDYIKNVEISPFKTGFGAGTKDFSHPNILRAFLCKDEIKDDSVTVFETCVDDTTGEQLGFCLKELFNIGVKDAYYTPVFMKKNRPGYMLTVLLDKEKEEAASEIIFKNTGSIGIRKRTNARITMQRKVINIKTKFGEFKVKVSSYGSVIKYKPEAEDVEKAAHEHGLCRQNILFEIEKEAQKQIFGQNE